MSRFRKRQQRERQQKIGIATTIIKGQGVTDSCTEQLNSCACKTAKGYINIDPLDAAKAGGQPKWSNIMGPDGISTYSYNPCTAYTAGTGDCTQVSACQTQYSTDYAIGAQESATFQQDPIKGTVIKYTSSDQARVSIVKLLCDPNTEEQFTADGEEPGSSPATYDFTLTTKYACSDIGKAPGGGGGGLSGGSVLLIIFFVCVTVYLIGGVTFNKVKKGASGTELVPNVEFWKTLPGLAKDGCIFAWTKITSICKGKQQGQYEKY